MHHLVFYLVLTAAALLASGCQKVVSDKLALAAETDCGFSQSPRGQRISWANRTPVTINISPGWPVEYLGVVQDAVLIWNNSLGYEGLKIAPSGTAAGDRSTRDSINGLYWVTDWPDDERQIQGKTTLYFLESEILESDIRVNGKHFRYYLDTPKDFLQVHLESLVLHELGHFLGLAHSALPPTVMEPQLPPQLKRVILSKGDINSLQCEYGS